MSVQMGYFDEFSFFIVETIQSQPNRTYDGFRIPSI